MSEVMILEQIPVIKHKLVEVGNDVSKRLADLNIDNQVATEDTIKTLKETKAELNKEAKNYDELRKIIKTSVLTPYNDFEAVYKEQISDKYKEADATLKTKINEFELKVKQEKKENVIAYFEELKDFEQLDWLKFEQLDMDINLSTSEKKYKVEVFGRVQKISDDLSLISTETHAAEILVEYKTSLNASQAIQLVRQRKQKEKEESDRILFERNRKRVDAIRKLQFISHDLTRTYNWVIDESVMVKYDEVENLSDEDWQKKYLELESKAKTKEEVKPQILQAPTISAPVPTPQPQPEVKEELFEAKFLVTGTYAEIKALGEFMKANNYKYQNID